MKEITFNVKNINEDLSIMINKILADHNDVHIVVNEIGTENIIEEKKETKSIGGLKYIGKEEKSIGGLRYIKKEEKSQCDKIKATEYLNLVIEEINHFTKDKCDINIHSLLKREIERLKSDSVLEMVKIARELNVIIFILY